MRYEELCKIVDEDRATVILEVEVEARGLVTEGRMTLFVSDGDSIDPTVVSVYLSPEARRTLAESLLDGLE